MVVAKETSIMIGSKEISIEDAKLLIQFSETPEGKEILKQFRVAAGSSRVSEKSEFILQRLKDCGSVIPLDSVENCAIIPQFNAKDEIVGYKANVSIRHEDETREFSLRVVPATHPGKSLTELWEIASSFINSKLT